MATKTVTMRVCDLCGKQSEELKHSVKIDEVEYKEVCDNCASQLTEFVKKLQTPKVSQYMKRKAKLAVEEQK